MDQVAAKQPVDAIHPRKIEQRFGRCLFTLWQGQCFTALELQIPATVANPCCANDLRLKSGGIVEQGVERDSMPVRVNAVQCRQIATFARRNILQDNPVGIDQRIFAVALPNRRGLAFDDFNCKRIGQTARHAGVFDPSIFQ